MADKTYKLSYNAAEIDELLTRAGNSVTPDDVYTKTESDALYMHTDAIVKLDSQADFDALTDKTADWYFIKEG